MFKGKGTIIVRDANGKEKRRQPIQENIVTKRAVERLLNDGLSVATDNVGIVISSDAPAADFERITLDNCLARGDGSLQGVDGRVFTPATVTEPMQITYSQRFPFPSAPRTIASMALTPQNSPNNDLGGTTEDIYSYLVFATPETQETNELVDLTYIVYLDWSGNTFNGINPNFQDALAQTYLGLTQQLFPILDANRIATSVLTRSDGDYDKLPAVNPGDTDGKALATTQTVDDPDLFIQSFSATLDLTATERSRHVFGLATGRPDNSIASNQVNKTFSSGNKGLRLNPPGSITPVYPNSPASLAINYDPNALPSGDWKPVITTDNSNDDLPTVYSLQIENNGGEGVATYSIWKTTFSGRPNYSVAEFSSNFTDWIQRPTALVETSLFPYLIKEHRDRALPINDKWFYSWKSDRFWVSGDGQKVGLWQIYPEFLLISEWDLAADINDIATNPDSDRIYAATEQGLIEIDTAGNSFSTLNSDPCKAVDVGFNGAVWAAFDDRLASSLNASWATAEDVTGMGITDWANVIFIRCDRDSSDHNLAIMEYRYNPRDPLPAIAVYNTWFSRVHFWDKTNGFDSTIDCLINSTTTTTYHPSITHPYSSSFVCQEGIWLFPVAARPVSYSLISIPGINNNFIRKAIADGLSNYYLNADDDVEYTPNSTLGIPGQFQLGIAEYGTPLRTNTSVTNGFNGSFPSYSLLNGDRTDGFIGVIIGGGNGFLFSSSYDSSALISGVGAFKFAVDAVSPATATGFAAYKDTEAQEKYIYTTRNGGGKLESFNGLSGNVQRLKGGGFVNLSGDRVISNPSIVAFASHRVRKVEGNAVAEQLGYFPLQVSAWGAPHIEDRLNSDWSVRYGWDSVNSVWIESDIEPAKPIHNTTEALIDGLSVAWTDLAPGTTNDLSTGERYTFIDMKGAGICNDGSLPTANFNWSYIFRPVAKNVAVSGTIASQTYTLPEATSDNLFISLNPYKLSALNLAIAGYGTPATIIDTGSPNANEILVANFQTGTLQFNAADEGKTLTGTYDYLKKFHPTEVL